MSLCNLCPRRCNVDRALGQSGFCLSGNLPAVAYTMRHIWEEPCIGGDESTGTGAVFFAGCNLRCIYCQNREISRNGSGNYKTYDAGELSDLILRLADSPVASISLITPTHFSDTVAAALREAKPFLHIPVVYNCGGYELPETLELFDGLVDIYLPDFKYNDSETAKKYSAAPDYPDVAETAIKYMYSSVGEVKFDSRGIMQKGLLVRHLMLPGHRLETLSLLERLSLMLPVDKFRLSLMSQYTPKFAADSGYKNLMRKLTTFEYTSATKKAEELGFLGYFQEFSSQSAIFTPDFKTKPF